MCVELILYEDGWICGENDLDYPKIGIEMAIINSNIGIAMARIN